MVVPREFHVTFEWVDWWNSTRLLGAIGIIPSAEAELLFYSQ